MKDVNWGEVTKAMQEGVVKVTFIKASDGTIREMDCTLAEYLLPEVYTSRPANPEVMVVYDIEAEGWRSFRKSSVLEIEVY